MKAETKDSWTWFLQLLEIDIGSFMMKGITFISVNKRYYIICKKIKFENMICYFSLLFDFMLLFYPLNKIQFRRLMSFFQALIINFVLDIFTPIFKRRSRNYMILRIAFGMLQEVPQCHVPSQMSHSATKWRVCYVDIRRILLAR